MDHRLPFPSHNLKKVLKVSSVNFSFKSYEDRVNIIDGFGRFLNSITEQIQIICDTKIIEPNEWDLKSNCDEYKNFLTQLVSQKSVAEKIFYVAFSAKDEFELKSSLDTVLNGLKRCGLFAEEVDENTPQIIPKIKPGYVKVGEVYYNTLIIKNWPYSCNSGWLEDLYNIDRNITISTFIEPQQKQYAIKWINQKIARLQSSVVVKEEKHNGEEDEEIITALNMRDELMKNEGKFFFTSNYITIKAKNLQDLKRDTKFLKTILGGMMIESKQATMRQDDGFRCSQPLVQNVLKSKCSYTFTTTPLKRFFPFISANIVDKGGIMVGENLQNNSLIFLNHFSYQTASMVVIGKTGAGKSYAVKSQADKLIKQGIEVTILDIEDEFGKMKKHENLKIHHFGKSLNSKYKDFLFKYWDNVSKNPNKPRFLIIDEIWCYIKDEEIAQLIQKISKLGRKRWLGLCPISQEVEDLLKNEYTKSLVNNCSIKILLQIEPNQKEIVKKTFGLTNQELSFLVSASEGEGIIFAGSNHVQFKTIVSDKQHKEFTTKPQEIYGEEELV